MPSPLDARRLVEESVPAAVVLLFWSVLAAIAQSGVALGLRIAGVVMALLYVVVRALTLADSLADDGQPIESEPILRENATVAVASGVWFLAALLFSAPLPIPRSIDYLFGLFSAISFALAATGVLTVVLYAVAVGIVRMRARSDAANPTGQPAAE
ncbi:hypothetical protein ACFR9U_07025 [Halorientalis brevis]|uniref:DUF2975 domain-containing protein n=1 Tax=Halorientalis brevis TaxID=1126241 RepID=A0ABD6C972_9EURY|nr:hypothetical protein [Halorientalis brevis]